MSVHTSAYVWNHSQHKGAELLLMLAIADITNTEGKAYPSISTLARYTRMSNRSIQRQLQSLEDSGELRISRNSGPHGTHIFQIVMNTTLPLFSDHGRPAGGEKAPREAVDKSVDIGGDNLSGGDKNRPKGVTKTPKRGDTVMSPEPGTKNLTIKERAARRTLLPAGFSISPAVRTWAAEKGFAEFLDLHLEHFRDYCAANQAKYEDWDAAFRNCIRADWGGIRRQVQMGVRRGEIPAGAMSASGAKPKVDAPTCSVVRDGRRCGKPMQLSLAKGFACCIDCYQPPGPDRQYPEPILSSLRAHAASHQFAVTA